MSSQPVTGQPLRGPAARAARLRASLDRPPVDLRPLLDPAVTDQGTRPVCLACAVAAGHEAARTMAGAAPQPLAPESIWWHAIQHGNATELGLRVIDADTALIDVGQPTTAVWPYNERLGILTEDPPADAGSPPWHIGSVPLLPLAHDGVENDLEDLLAAGIPVLLLVEVTDQFCYPDDDGYVAAPDLRAPLGDYHAVLCVGAATHPKRGRLLLIRNSWGPAWGAGGYCWLPLTYLIAHTPQAAFIKTGPPHASTPDKTNAGAQETLW